MGNKKAGDAYASPAFLLYAMQSVPGPPYLTRLAMAAAIVPNEAKEVA